MYIDEPFKPNTTCVMCGRRFYKRPSHKKRQVDPNFNTCSRKCRADAQRGERNHAWKGGQIKKNCMVCGKEFFVRYGRKDTAKYCSPICKGIALSGEASARYTSKYIPCDNCGKQIRRSAYFLRNGQKNYCGKKCQNQAHAKRMAGIGNINWRGGIGKLPWGFEFNENLKSQIKHRDGYSCQICGAKKTVLAVHHIDYDKLNNSFNNLITLCEKCHGKTNYNRKNWQKELSRRLKGKESDQEKFTI